MDANNKELLRQVQELLEASDRRLAASYDRIENAIDKFLISMGGTASSSTTSACIEVCNDTSPPGTISGDVEVFAPTCCNPDASLVVAIDVEDLTTPTPARCSMEGPSHDSTELRSASALATAPTTPTASIDITSELAALVEGHLSCDIDAATLAAPTHTTCSPLDPGQGPSKVDPAVMSVIAGDTETVNHPWKPLPVLQLKPFTELELDALVPAKCSTECFDNGAVELTKMYMAMSHEADKSKILGTVSTNCDDGPGDERRPPWPPPELGMLCSSGIQDHALDQLFEAWFTRVLPICTGMRILKLWDPGDCTFALHSSEKWWTTPEPTPLYDSEQIQWSYVLCASASQCGNYSSSSTKIEGKEVLIVGLLTNIYCCQTTTLQPTKETMGSELVCYYQASKFHHEAMLELQLTSSGNSCACLHELHLAKCGTEGTAPHRLFINMHSCQLKCHEFTSLKYKDIWSSTTSVLTEILNMFNSHPTAAVMSELAFAVAADHSWDEPLLSSKYPSISAGTVQILLSAHLSDKLVSDVAVAIWWFPSAPCKYLVAFRLHQAHLDGFCLHNGALWNDRMTSSSSRFRPHKCMRDVHLIILKSKQQVAVSSNSLPDSSSMTIFEVWLLNHQAMMQIQIEWQPHSHDYFIQIELSYKDNGSRCLCWYHGESALLFWVYGRQEVFQGGRCVVIYIIHYLVNDSYLDSFDYLDYDELKVLQVPWDLGVCSVSLCAASQEVQLHIPWEPGGIELTTAWGQAVFQGGGGVRDPPTWAWHGYLRHGLGPLICKQRLTNYIYGRRRNEETIQRITDDTALSLVSLLLCFPHPCFSDLPNPC